MAESFEEKRLDVKVRRIGVPMDLNGERPVVLNEDVAELLTNEASAD